VSRYGFTGAGCAWHVGYDEPSASFYAYADPRTHRFDVDASELRPERGTEHWSVAWDDESRAIACSRTESLDELPGAPTEHFATLEQLVEATGGQVPAGVRKELAQAITLPRFVFGDRGNLVTHDDLLAVIAPLVDVPVDTRARLAADDPFNPTGDRDVISDAIAAPSIEHMAAALEAAREDALLEETLTETYPIEDTPDLPDVETGPSEHDDADNPTRRRGPLAGDLLRRLELLVEPVAEIAATIEQPPMRHGPTMHS
jgi:hypothetical protein